MSEPLRGALARLPDDALVPVWWVREQLDASGPTLPADVGVSEVATALGRSESTVRSWIRDGRLPGAYRLGRCWRVPHDALCEIRSRPASAEGAPEVGDTLRLDAWRRARTATP